MQELKNIIEQGNFKIELINFKPKVKKFLNQTRIYILKSDRKVYFLGLSYDIKDIFRKLIKDVYGDLWFKDYPESFFKDYLHKEYLKGNEQTKQTEINKKPYYAKMRILRKENKIKRLQEEILKESENLKIMKGGN